MRALLFVFNSVDWVFLKHFTLSLEQEAGDACRDIDCLATVPDDVKNCRRLDAFLA